MRFRRIRRDLLNHADRISLEAAKFYGQKGSALKEEQAEETEPCLSRIAELELNDILGQVILVALWRASNNCHFRLNDSRKTVTGKKNYSIIGSELMSIISYSVNTISIFSSINTVNIRDL